MYYSSSGIKCLDAAAQHMCSLLKRFPVIISNVWVTHKQNASSLYITITIIYDIIKAAYSYKIQSDKNNKSKTLKLLKIYEIQLLPFYSHYRGQPALGGTYSYEMEGFV